MLYHIQLVPHNCYCFDYGEDSGTRVLVTIPGVDGLLVLYKKSVGVPNSMNRFKHAHFIPELLDP
jgi:hypothetical protein